MPTESEFRKYIDDDGNEDHFVVFIAHGHAKHWQTINDYVRNELHFKTVVSMEEFMGGSVLKKIQKAIWFQCDCGVAILSPDDELHNGVKNARPNVIFEIGYCMGFWDSYYWEDEELEPVILIKEKSVQLNSDLDGIELIMYEKDDIEMVKKRLKQGLERIYNYLHNGKKLKLREDSNPDIKKLKKDFQVIKHFMKDKNWLAISFQNLEHNVHPHFTEQHIMDMVKVFPEKMRRCKLKNGRKGIKLLS